MRPDTVLPVLHLQCTSRAIATVLVVVRSEYEMFPIGVEYAGVAKDSVTCLELFVTTFKRIEPFTKATIAGDAVVVSFNTREGCFTMAPDMLFFSMKALLIFMKSNLAGRKACNPHSYTVFSLRFKHKTYKNSKMN